MSGLLQKNIDVLRVKKSALSAMLILALACLPFLALRAQDAPPLGSPELEQLVAPVALYPDELLSQVLIASTYPLEVVEADRWVKNNKGASASGQSWDESIKALTQTPDVLKTMSENLGWTQKLGDAVLQQQDDVMDAIQRLRARAYAQNMLVSNEQQMVETEPAADGGGQGTIIIQSAVPDTVYVPYYEPAVVYGSWPYPSYPPYYYPPPPGYGIIAGIAFGAGIALADDIWDDGFDWNNGDIDVDINQDINNRPRTRGDGTKWKHDPAHRHGVQYRNEALNKKYAPHRTTTRQSSEQMRQQFRGRPDQTSGQAGLENRDMNRANAGDFTRSRDSFNSDAKFHRQSYDMQRQAHSSFSGVGDGRQARADSMRGQRSLSGNSRNYSGSSGSARRSGGGGARRGGGGGGRRR